ncbi:MAG: DUF1697 domain-containing protein [Gemmatimonadetes bacterium]|nr:DUF1697 domain-containing protein [Gemmatimonadota bacterium]
MSRYVAFLRAVNVGGRTVRMDALRAHFEALGFVRVATFIASGNVIFETRASERTLEAKIEKFLAKALGFETAVFVRSDTGLAEISSYEAFPAERRADRGARVYVAFARDRPSGAAARRVEALSTPTDALHVHDREVWWRSRVSMRESPVSGAAIEKALGAQVTLRNVNTVERLVTKLGIDS